MDILSSIYTLSHYAEGHAGMEIEKSYTARIGKAKATSYEDLVKIQS